MHTHTRVLNFDLLFRCHPIFYYFIQLHALTDQYISIIDLKSVHSFVQLLAYSPLLTFT